MKNPTPRTYACIDLKSFYASVECRERGLDPLTTNLVVADESRTDKTICLAVSPALKEYGIPGRPRLFEVREKVRAINLARKNQNQTRQSQLQPHPATSVFTPELERNPSLALDFIIAPPRMRLYMQRSVEIYRTYLEFLSSDDILVYSIDEVFLDLTDYLHLYHTTAEELVTRLISAVFQKTGITATAGIGPNLYLAKVAMDITAKHMPPDQNGVRLATLDEFTYREKLWSHWPLTDFWRVGRGYAKKLEAHGIRTMGDVARVSLDNEDLLYRLFGVNAEFLIDHAWGYEPCTLPQAKSYRPSDKSLTEGQVLPGPYSAPKARLVLQEMCDELALTLVRRHLVSRQFVLTLIYQKQPGQAHSSHTRGTVNISHLTSSTRTIMREVTRLYDEILRPGLKIRKINLVASHVVSEDTPDPPAALSQLDLFGEFKQKIAAKERALAREKSERSVQRAVLQIKERYGKNAILRAMDFEDGATARKRNGEVGGHHA